MKVTGVKRLEKRLSRMEKDVKRAVADENEEAGKDLRAEVARRAPIDAPPEGGTLRASAFYRLEDGGMSVVVGFEGGADEYMWVQHEELDFEHPRGGEAKFLENPYNERKGGYAKAIKKAARKAARNGR